MFPTPRWGMRQMREPLANLVSHVYMCSAFCSLLCWWHRAGLQARCCPMPLCPFALVKVKSCQPLALLASYTHLSLLTLLLGEVLFLFPLVLNTWWVIKRPVQHHWFQLATLRWSAYPGGASHLSAPLLPKAGHSLTSKSPRVKKKIFFYSPRITLQALEVLFKHPLGH